MNEPITESAYLAAIDTIRAYHAQFADRKAEVEALLLPKKGDTIVLLATPARKTSLITGGHYTVKDIWPRYASRFSDKQDGHTLVITNGKPGHRSLIDTISCEFRLVHQPHKTQP